MKELIHEEKGSFLFWKVDNSYHLLFLASKKRKTDAEYALSKAEIERYFELGLVYIKDLAKKMK